MLNINKISNSAGVYKFYNSKKELIYIGKATNLKNRVRSYFGPQKTNRPIEQMIKKIKYIKTIETDSVLEAIILEANLIKKYQPKYNAIGKDDKSWNYILITKDEYPRVETIRQHEYLLNISQDKNFIKKYKKIFGPYPGLKTKEMLDILQKIFNISFCKPNSKRACLDYQMKRCLGVCINKISPKDYNEKVIKPLIYFLNGNKKILIKNLEKEMLVEAKKENFEESTRLRNQINKLQKIQDISLLNKSFFRSGLEKEDQNKFRIEAYDISNLGKENKVASLVVFDKNGPIKKDYRKFKIKDIIGQSDVDCLKEVFERRLKYLNNNFKNSFSIKPDLILVDGGKPQVNAVNKILKENKIDIPLVGIAKGKTRKKNEFILGTKDREVIKWIYKNQNILIEARDEAHRFAITYQRKLMNEIKSKVKSKK